MTRHAGAVVGMLFLAHAAAANWAQQGTTLSSPIWLGGEGTSVSLSGDGNTAIIGSFDQGALVFTRSGGVWSQQLLTLYGSGPVGNAKQGRSVAISADGNTAIIGGPFDNSQVGAAWVFTRSGGVWSQQGNKLVAFDSVGATLVGSSVAISGDGNTAIVGGPFDNSSVGAAWVFARSGGVWSQQGSKLVGTDTTPDGAGAVRQGWSVAISADGNTAIVGGTFDNGGIGATWVFTRSGGVWSQQGSKLVGTDALGTPQQGYSVAVSADGNTAIVGGSYDNSQAGAAWVFARSGGVWSQQGSKLFGTDARGYAWQGTSVAISGDGNTAIVGGPHDNDPLHTGAGIGAAWLFTRSGGVWSQLGNKLVGTGADGHYEQGTSVAMSADGNTAIVGGPNGGAAWMFSAHGCIPPSITSQPQSQTIQSGQTATLSVTATGTALSYQWYQGTSGDTGQPVGPNASIVTTPALAATTNYWVRVSNSCGYADSATATITISSSCTSPSITAQPQGQTIASGQTATLSVIATGSTPLAYQWYQGSSGNTSNPVGTNSSSFTTPTLTATMSYWVRVSNTCGNADSATATITISSGCTPPSITSQTLNMNIQSGQTATLSVTATGTAPLSYQWYQGASGNTAQPVGPNASSFTTPVLTATTSYWVRVSNSCGHADSATATVTVESAPIHIVWVPVAAHNPGLKQSQWRSDLGLLNTGSVTANVQIEVFLSGGVVTNTTYVPPGTQSILTDVVGQLGVSGQGALKVTSDQPLKVTSRTYNQVSSGASCYPNGTQGQDYPALATSDGLAAGQSAYLAGLTENASYRCNIGLVDVGPGAATVLVELYNGAGTKLTDYTVTLPAGQWVQDIQPFRNRAGQTSMDRGYAKITVLQSGSGVFAFASVVDNLTNDPTTVAMQR